MDWEARRRGRPGAEEHWPEEVDQEGRRRQTLVRIRLISAVQERCQGDGAVWGESEAERRHLGGAGDAAEGGRDLRRRVFDAAR